MSDENGPPKLNWKIKLLSYFITAIIASLMGKTASGIASNNNTLGIVVGLTVFIVLSIADIRSGILIILQDLSDSLRAGKEFLTEPKFSSAKRIIRELLDFWHISLVNPILYSSTIQYEVLKNGNLRRFIPVQYKLSLLLFLNALIVWILGLIVRQKNSFLDMFIIFWFIPSVILVYAIFSQRKNLKNWPVLSEDTISLSGITLLFLLLCWANLLWNITGYLGINIVVNSFFVGIAIPFIYKLNAKINKNLFGFALETAFVFALLGGGCTSVNQFSPELVNDPVFSPVNNFYKGFLDIFLTSEDQLLNDNNQSAPNENETQFAILAPFTIFLAISTLAFIGFFPGVLFNVFGFIYALVEAPFFYVGWFCLVTGREQQGRKLLRKIFIFDEIRVVNWWGIDQCYKLLLKVDIESAFSTLAYQYFYTFRQKFAINQLSELLLLLEDNQYFDAFLPILPLTEFEQKSKLYHPNIATLRFNDRDKFFEAILKRRHNIFQKILDKVTVNTTTEFDVLLLRGLDAISNFDFENIELGRKNAQIIRSGFGQYRNYHIADMMFLLGDATYNSLSIDNFEKIGEKLIYWNRLQDYIIDKKDFLYLYTYTSILINFAKLVSEIREDVEPKLGEMALSIFDLQSRFENDLIETTFGLGQIILVTQLWENLLREYLRRSVTK